MNLCEFKASLIYTGSSGPAKETLSLNKKGKKKRRREERKEGKMKERREEGKGRREEGREGPIAISKNVT